MLQFYINYVVYGVLLTDQTELHRSSENDSAALPSTLQQKYKILSHNSLLRGQC